MSATSATGAAGHAGVREPSLPVGAIPLAEPLGEELHELLPVPHAVGVRPEARVVRERGKLERVAAQRNEDPVVSASDHQLPVSRLEDLVRRDHREGRALPR